MAKVINVRLTEINSTISKLQSLKRKCTSADTKSPAIIGGGQTVNELEAIAEIYKSMNTDFATLIQNTIMFLNNVKDSYSKSDKKACTGMGGR